MNVSVTTQLTKPFSHNAITLQARIRLRANASKWSSLWGLYRALWQWSSTAIQLGRKHPACKSHPTLRWWATSTRDYPPSKLYGLLPIPTTKACWRKSSSRSSCCWGCRLRQNRKGCRREAVDGSGHLGRCLGPAKLEFCTMEAWEVTQSSVRSTLYTEAEGQSRYPIQVFPRRQIQLSWAASA